MRKRDLTPLLLCLACSAFVVSWSNDSGFAAQETSVDTRIIHALLRDFAIPERDKYRNDPPLIAVVTESLRQCAPPIVRSCVLPEVLAVARNEAAKGTWTYDLVGELVKRTKDSVEFTALDVTGFTRVVVGKRVALDRLYPTSLPLVISRPAVSGRSALVIVQFARLSTWLVLLTENGTTWTVTTTVAYGMS